MAGRQRAARCYHGWHGRAGEGAGLQAAPPQARRAMGQQHAGAAPPGRSLAAPAKRAPHSSNSRVRTSFAFTLFTPPLPALPATTTCAGEGGGVEQVGATGVVAVQPTGGRGRRGGAAQHQVMKHGLACLPALQARMQLCPGGSCRPAVAVPARLRQRCCAHDTTTTNELHHRPV